jgi:hypothetical protein
MNAFGAMAEPQARAQPHARSGGTGAPRMLQQQMGYGAVVERDLQLCQVQRLVWCLKFLLYSAPGRRTPPRAQ